LAAAHELAGVGSKGVVLVPRRDSVGTSATSIVNGPLSLSRYDQQRQRDQLRVGAEARVWIDILVNSVWGGCEGMIENGVFTWSKPFWEQPLWRWDAVFYAGVRAHYHASQLAAPMMIAQSATAGSRRNGGNCQKGPEKRKSRAISGPKDDDPHPRYDLTKALIEITMSVVA
jgi:NAD(P)-dependent dehydrogenase (short-subunit alcohol dehydrogenase family)